MSVALLVAVTTNRREGVDLRLIATLWVECLYSK